MTNARARVITYVYPTRKRPLGRYPSLLPLRSDRPLPIRESWTPRVDRTSPGEIPSIMSNRCAPFSPRELLRPGPWGDLSYGSETFQTLRGRPERAIVQCAVLLSVVTKAYGADWVTHSSRSSKRQDVNGKPYSPEQQAIV